jgi:DNA-binding HxlR family transcriptional regulator
MKYDNPQKCPLTAALHIIGGKWKPLIIKSLDKMPKRFGQLDAQIPAISRKVLTTQLEELMEADVVMRTAYAEAPPRVEYHLTKKGKRLIPILNQLCKWGCNILEEEEKMGVEKVA